VLPSAIRIKAFLLGIGVGIGIGVELKVLGSDIAGHVRWNVQIKELEKYSSRVGANGEKNDPDTDPGGIVDRFRLATGGIVERFR